MDNCWAEKKKVELKFNEQFAWLEGTVNISSWKT